ncbi:MAG: phage baseplate assembly protein V, partial [Pseudomonadota bacterium]
MSDELYRIRQLERRVSNLIRGGVVAEVQANPPRVRVEYDIDENDEPVISAWLRYYEERNGHVSTWNPPKIGEQATIIAPNG